MASESGIQSAPNQSGDSDRSPQTSGELRCVTCGLPTISPYCPECGEQRASDRRYSLRAFVAEAFEIVTNTDNRIWRTFRDLLLRPGTLTNAYMQGVRVPYMKPLQLFLVVNVAYFVWAAYAGERVFDTRLQNHLANSNYGPTAVRLVRARMAERGLSADSYAAVFDSAATVHAKSLIIVMVPMFAIVLAAVQIRRRRPFVQHLLFALHLYAVVLLLSIAQRYLLQWPLRSWSHLSGVRLRDATADTVIMLSMLGAIGVYLLLALRRAYGEGRYAALLKSVLLSTAVLVILGLYRAALFFATYWVA